MISNYGKLANPKFSGQLLSPPLAFDSDLSHRNVQGKLENAVDPNAPLKGDVDLPGAQVGQIEFCPIKEAS